MCRFSIDNANSWSSYHPHLPLKPLMRVVCPFKRLSSSSSIHSYHLASSSMRSLTILVFAALTLLLSKGQADESPGFFLKITKNVPRLGKRTESFVMKNMKTIPRMGRSDPQVSILITFVLGYSTFHLIFHSSSPLSIHCSPGCGTWSRRSRR